MFDTRNRRWLVPLLIGGLALAGDQASKLWIVNLLGPEPYQRAIPLIEDWFRFIYAHNTGIAFSLFQGWPQIFIFTSLLISIGAIYVYWKHLPNHDTLVQISIGLIIAGALGNVIDRIRLGYVIDFIQVGWWPVFNVADSAICVGAVLLALHSLVVDRATGSGEQAIAQ